MSRLAELMDVDALERQIAARFIARHRHPTLPLSILDYTTRAQLAVSA